MMKRLDGNSDPRRVQHGRDRRVERTVVAAGMGVLGHLRPECATNFGRTLYLQKSACTSRYVMMYDLGENDGHAPRKPKNGRKLAEGR